MLSAPHYRVCLVVTVKMTDLPADDRPRERLLREGASALSDAELVAIQLGSGAAGTSALEVAQHLLVNWGGIKGLSMAHPADLAKLHGIGPAKAARLAASFRLGSRASISRGERRKLATSADIAEAAIPEIADSPVENMLVLVADGASQLKRTEVVATGSAKTCPVPIREIIATVLRHDGIAFAVAHNHPGGDPSPTASDLKSTEMLREAAATVGLRFLDHVVVTQKDWRSASQL